MARVGRPQRGKEEAPAALDPVLTVAEVARYLRVHPSTIYRLVKKRELPAFKVGNDWRFDVEALNEWRLGPGVPMPRKK